MCDSLWFNVRARFLYSSKTMRVSLCDSHIIREELYELNFFVTMSKRCNSLWDNFHFALTYSVNLYFEQQQNAPHIVMGQPHHHSQRIIRLIFTSYFANDVTRYGIISISTYTHDIKNVANHTSMSVSVRVKLFANNVTSYTFT